MGKLLILLLFIFFSIKSYCQPTDFLAKNDINTDYRTDAFNIDSPDDDYVEISIMLYVKRIGSCEIPAIIHGQQVYLSVKELFDFLKIRNLPSAGFDSVSGFFINPNAPYLFDKNNNKISYGGKVFNIPPGDMIQKPTALFVQSEYFGNIFGLACTFNFRNLAVTLDTKIELPAIREMQLEMMRNNNNSFRGVKTPDTVIRKSYPMLKLGMADWSVISTQRTNEKTNIRANLGIGALIAGGELNLSLNYNSDVSAGLRQQFYQWRFVNNDLAAVKQVTLGKIFAQSTASVFAPVVGFRVSNSPTTYRRSFGTYTISNFTEPGWTVELYVNNILLNYTKADASGFYTFEVPLVYGNSVVETRFYGPWGEEQRSVKYMNIPFSFIPVGRFEYNVTAGIVEDEEKSRYSRAAFNYGLGRNITIGGGIEYLSSVTSGKTMPYINASAKLGQYVLVSGEHSYGVRSKGLLNFRLPSRLQVDINYTHYNKGQKAIRVNYLDEKKLAVSMPFSGKKVTAYSRLTLNQFRLPENEFTGKRPLTKYTSADFLLSAVYAGISSNFTTAAIFTGIDRPNIYSSLSLGFRFPYSIRFIPQAQYRYDLGKFSMVKAELEKRLGKTGFVNLSYEKNILNNISLVNLGLRLNFSFAQTSFSVSHGNRSTAAVQSARGSLMYDKGPNYIAFTDQVNVGRGGLVISPFLDLNCNGKHDPGEPKAFGLGLRINGGSIKRNDADTTIRITGLEAYADYLIELDNSNFENVAWRLSKKTISITAAPNHFKLIEVPVAVMGEVNGTVFKQEPGTEQKGTGRIIVNFYNNKGEQVGRTVTESDGYFSFMALKPGAYVAQVDSNQLQKLHWVSVPIPFNILSKTDGDYVSGLNLMLYSIQK